MEVVKVPENLHNISPLKEKQQWREQTLSEKPVLQTLNCNAKSKVRMLFVQSV